MKKLLALAISLFPVIAFAAPAPPAADYDLPVHVTQSKLEQVCVSGLCNYALHLTGTIAGKKVEVVETKIRMAVLHTGDYKARVAKTGEGKAGIASYEDQITYEILMPDGTKRQFIMVGEEE